jgi:hypothetical protein
MFTKLRIIFTLLAATCLVAVVPIGTFLGLGWAGWTAVGAGACFIFMLLCKQEEEIRAKKNKNKPPETDFLSASSADKNVEQTNSSENNE